MTDRQEGHFVLVEDAESARDAAILAMQRFRETWPEEYECPHCEAPNVFHLFTHEVSLTDPMERFELDFTMEAKT